MTTTIIEIEKDAIIKITHEGVEHYLPAEVIVHAASIIKEKYTYKNDDKKSDLLWEPTFL